MLLNHYRAPMRVMFKQFRSGVIYFAVGLITIYLADQTLEESTTQELIVLAGLTLAACGFVIAILAHIRMIIARLLRFFEHKK